MDFWGRYPLPHVTVVWFVGLTVHRPLVICFTLLLKCRYSGTLTSPWFGSNLVSSHRNWPGGQVDGPADNVVVWPPLVLIFLLTPTCRAVVSCLVHLCFAPVCISLTGHSGPPLKFPGVCGPYDVNSSFPVWAIMWLTSKESTVERSVGCWVSDRVHRVSTEVKLSWTNIRCYWVWTGRKCC